MAIIKLYEKNNPPERIGQIVETLRNGGVIIYPTGATYALGCHALKERAIERIYKIKQTSPAAHPLSVICYDMSAISEYAHITTPIYKIMKRNLPGPFTFILPGKTKLPRIFRSHKSGEVGIRMPDSPIIREILYQLEAPMMTASLPLPHESAAPEYLINPELIDEAWGNQVDWIVDGGIGCMGETTIIDCHDDEPNIIRQGNGVLH